MQAEVKCVKKEKKKGRSLFYRISAWLHLWLGLVTGLVVIVVSITGAILVFEQELRVMFQPFQTVSSNGKSILQPSVLKAAAMKAYNLPEVSCVVYQGEGRCAVVPYYEDRKNMLLTYIDPYTARPLHSVPLEKDFFRRVLAGHYNLWLPRPYGDLIVSYSTMIFVITLITGLVLWWPRKWTKATRKQAFKIKTDATPKRLNYDLHNVLGFYSLIIGLILGLTGIVYGIQWFSKAVYFTASGGQQRAGFKRGEKKEDVPTLVRTSATPDEDSIFTLMHTTHPDVEKEILVITYPEGKGGAWSTSLSKELNKSAYEFGSYEQVSLKPKKKKPENGGDRYMRLNYDLHLGSVGGITTKILAFLACIICASLPITGFIIWWGKKK
jgi:uncharacterized iron-regulated membrane protein